VDILGGYVLNSFQREQESDIYENIWAEYLLEDSAALKS
jgi:hypothetical protein